MEDSNSEQNHESGSFSSGLVLGFLAGATSYFLMRTKEGQEIREKFSKHWHDIRENLVEEGKLTDAEADITDYIKAARSKISEILGESEHSNTKRKLAKKKQPKTRKKKLFKGI